MRNRSVIRRDERGATLVIVSAFVIVAVIMTAAVVDLGGLRAEKKEVTLSTDAAALAAVSSIDYADPDATGNGTDCADVSSIDAPQYPTVEDVADRYLTENGQSILGTCEIFFGATGANQTYLTVTASDDVEYAFGKAIGQNSGSTTGVSSARAGSASVDGVYPIGYCASDGLLDFVNDDEDFPQSFGGQREITMDFGNSNCDSNGNHDQIDFGNFTPGCGQADAPGQFCYDLNNGGFDGTVPPSIGSNPGASWNQTDVERPIDDLESRAVHIWVPAVGVGGSNGNPGTFPVEYLVEVVITDFRPTGNDKGLTMDVYQVVDYAYYAANGLPLTTVNAQVRAHICATSADTSGCTNNPALTPPPPPPPPPTPCTVDTVSTNPSSPVSVTSAGELVGPLIVDVTVEDVGNCADVGLEAVGPVTVVAPAPPPPSGNTYTFTYASGTAFSPVDGSVFDLEFSDRGVVRDDTTSIMTITPRCAVASVQPLTATVPVTGSGNPRTTTEARSWTVTISNPELCGAISGQLVGPSTLGLSPPSSSASTTMTLTLDGGAEIVPGNRGGTWSVRISSTSGATTTLISNTGPQNSGTIVIG